MKHILTTILFLVFAGYLVGQSQFRVETISYEPKNGLSGRFGNYTFKDSRGLIWIGTQHGLNRFDGRNFKIFDVDNGLPFNQVMEIYEDQENYLWLYRSCFSKPKDYCTKKLVFFHAISQKVLSFEDRFGEKAPFSPEEIIHISSSKSGKWFCIRTAERNYRWSLDTGFKAIPPNELDVTADIFDILEDGRMGATLRTDSSYIYYLLDNNGKIIYQQTLSIDPFEVHFYKTFPPFDRKKSEKFLRREIALVNNKITYTNEFGDSFWYSIGEDGLLKETPFPLHLIQQRGLSNRHLFIDESNNTYWVANRAGAQFVRIEKNKFNNVKLKDNYDMFLSIKALENDYNFIGGPSFLYHGQLENYSNISIDQLNFKDFKNNHFINEPFLEANIDEVRNAKTFFAYLRQLVLITADFQVRKLTIKTVGDQFRENNQCVQKVGDDLLIGTRAGLFIYNIEKRSIEPLSEVNGFESFGNSSVHFIYPIDEDQAWAGTNQGIYKLSKSKGVLEYYGAEQDGNYNLPVHSVYHIIENGDGTFWLATRKGLVHWAADRTQDLENGKRFKIYSKTEGMPDNICNAVYKDDFGFLWISTVKGIAQFDITNERIKRYDHKDGLDIEYFIEYGHDKDPEGNILFGGIGGFVQFNPIDFKDANFDEVEIPLILVELEQYNSTTQDFEDRTLDFIQNKLITLNPDANLFTIRVALSDFRAADQHQFEYKIPGYIEEWQTDASNLIRLSGLPYGHLKLLIRGRLPDGVYSSEILELPIKVLKPFYLTWWFIVGAILLVIIMAWLWYIRRIHKFKAQQQELEIKVEERTTQIAEDKKIIEKQAQELLELDEVKSRFFANVSHELRTPITLIKDPINQVLKADEWNARSKKLLIKAKESTSKLLSLVNEILHLTRLDAKKMGLEETNILLYDFLRKIISSFESVAESKGIEIRFVFQPKDHLQIKLDAVKFEKIINNLITNAFKFTPSGGNIQIEVRNVEGYFQLMVQDNGRGIPEGELSRVFDRFYQSSSNKAAEGGFGIGLSLCKEYVKLMDGRIWVENRKNENGTIFYVQIPRVEVVGTPQISSLQMESSNAKVTQEQINSSKANILVVEDNVDLQEYIQFLLSDHYEVFAVGHGKAALEFLKENPQVDLIISDLMMPIMDGFELLNSLKTNQQQKGKPIIMLTARADVNDRLKALRLGVDDYITKPFEADELLVRIENLLQNAKERRKWSAPEKIEEEPPKMDVQLSKHDSEWLENLTQIIQDRLKDHQFRMEDLANELAISRRQLFRKTKEVTGLTPKQLLIEARLQTARQLLERKEVFSIKEATYESGFQTPSHFSDLFKKRFGKKPSDLLHS